jgi:hypothetical protein
VQVHFFISAEKFLCLRQFDTLQFHPVATRIVVTIGRVHGLVRVAGEMKQHDEHLAFVDRRIFRFARNDVGAALHTPKDIRFVFTVGRGTPSALKGRLM